MTNEEFEAAIMPLYEARPFQSYIIEMNDGSRHLIEKPFAVGFRDGHVTFSTRGRGPRFIHCIDQFLYFNMWLSRESP
jgi:hypothetical protein